MTALIELYRNLVGAPPAGLEWLEYLFLNLFVFFSLWLVYKILHEFFHSFDKH